VSRSTAAPARGKKLELRPGVQVGEHPTLSKPATVDLGAVFAKTGLKLTSMSETMLTANQAR
jgi:hypothetical protein